MNFLTDKDGVTKKDMSFLIVMMLYIFVTVVLVLIAIHDYFTSGLTDMNMTLFTMVFDSSTKVMILVVSAFYGTQVAVSIITKGKVNLPTIFKGKDSKEADPEETVDDEEDFVPPSEREENYESQG